jgi:methyl-accepting chemotaxis protein
MILKVTPRELKAFRNHLVIASFAFALVLALGTGVLTLVRWAFPLEMASSSPQAAFEATGRILELHQRFWPVAFVSLTGVALAAAWLGRRIIGPFTRFTRAFQQLAAGQFPEPLQLRSGDYLAAEVAAVNQLIVALKERAGERASALGALVATLEELNERIREGGRADAIELSERALEQVKDLDGRSS